MSLYLLLKWIHVLAAITALGANLTYVVWIRLGERSQQNLLHSLRGIQFLDERIANSAYGVVVVTVLVVAIVFVMVVKPVLWS